MVEESPLQAPALLTERHNRDEFDCGSEPLNQYLRQHAWVNQQAGAARTYVATCGDRLVGYYTLAYGSIEHQEATPRVRKGLARHPIPVMALARLAVDQSYHGRGIGKGLLRDALLRTLQAAEIAGLRAVIVHAKDPGARSFYARFGFESSPLDEFHLMLLLKDLRRMVAESRGPDADEKGGG